MVLSPWQLRSVRPSSLFFPKLALSSLTQHLCLVWMRYVLPLCHDYYFCTWLAEKGGCTDQKVWLFILAAGVLTALLSIFSFHSLKLGHASRTASFEKISPVITAVLAIVFLKEKFTWQLCVGLVLVVAVLYLLAFHTLQSKSYKKPGGAGQLIMHIYFIVFQIWPSPNPGAFAVPAMCWLQKLLNRCLYSYYLLW